MGHWGDAARSGSELVKEAKYAIQSTNSQVSAYLNQIKECVSHGGYFSNPINEMFLCMSLRTTTELIISLSQDFFSLRSLLGGLDGSEIILAQGAIDALESLSIDEMSKLKPLIDLLCEPLGILYKYVSLFVINKSSVEGIPEFVLQNEKEVKQLPVELDETKTDPIARESDRVSCRRADFARESVLFLQQLRLSPQP